MNRRAPMPGSRPVLAALALAGFGAAVALVGAGSAGPDRHSGGSSTADTVVTTIAVLVAATALAFTAFVARRTRRPPQPSGGPAPGVPAFLLQPVIAPLLATLLLLLFSALVIGPCLSNQPSEPLRLDRRDRPAVTTARPEQAPSRSDPRPDWSVVTGFVLGAAGLALAVVIARNRRGPTTVETDEIAFDDEIARSLADLDSLEQDPDHRRVVIRAYARMERALGRAGIVREPSETAQQFLRRALAGLGASGAAAAELTRLFEEARFSPHRVDASMRARAATSLRTVRDEIATDVYPTRRGS